MELGKVKISKMTGKESFHIEGKSLDFDLLSFWQWSSSEILGNALRGVLAEYIVAKDIDCPYEIREEWDAYDLLTPEGWKIEVKSASYIQSWEQSKLSTISFGIQPTIIWENDTTRSQTPKRQADVYVFCLLAHKDQNSIDPLNLSQWEFYVLPTSTLNEKVGHQKSITLSSLLKLEPNKCSFGNIKDAIRNIQS
ncbi:hypothetical protein LOH54_07085 [Sulfurimonas sp. HSL-3221]|uniref:hypothetical protein n=1 Tax=Sulfurimonadaceae TaxID=2771471 RepID=UPI001E2CEAFE|nr:hypothetical protein [Sulfurimonas sp. HSL-3221]UFS61424.1 hypothetical protein LOH54_07085 [Sulfurimonas sp. HSL-3221]